MKTGAFAGKNIVRPLCLAATLLCVSMALYFIISNRINKGVCPHCSVILIAVDTLADRDIDCAGKRDRTPNLCAFSDTSVRAERTYAPDSWTLPNIFSVFTSQLPSTHHMLDIGIDLDPRIVALPQVYKKNGYDTVYVGPLDNPHLPLKNGFERGFDTLLSYDNIRSWENGLSKIPTESGSGKPVFLFLSTFDTHSTWLQSDLFVPYKVFTREIWQRILDEANTLSIRNKTLSFGVTSDLIVFEKFRREKDFAQAEKYFSEFSENIRDYYYAGPFLKDAVDFSPDKLAALRVLYDRRIMELDRNFAGIFEYMKTNGILDRSIVIITGTHGESFGEHGAVGHGNELFDEMVHVPLIVSIPGARPRKISDLVQTTDIFPTVLALTGIPSQPKLEGRNLAGLFLRGNTSTPNEFVIGEHGTGSESKAIRNTVWSLHITNGDEANASLYDVRTDPLEYSNVAVYNPDRVRLLHNKLNHLLLQQPIFD